MRDKDEDDAGPIRRLFVAVDAPPAVAASLACLATAIAGVRWARPEAMHLTIRFIGDTGDDATTTLRERLRAIHCVSFVLTIGGIGAFPQRGRAQTLWAGVGNAHPRLHQLRQKVDDAILATGLSPDMRSFHPHITLARCGPVNPGALRDFLHRHAGLGGPAFMVDRFHLFESRLLPGGAEHRIIGTFSLAAG